MRPRVCVCVCHARRTEVWVIRVRLKYQVEAGPDWIPFRLWEALLYRDAAIGMSYFMATELFCHAISQDTGYVQNKIIVHCLLHNMCNEKWFKLYIVGLHDIPVLR